MKGSEKIEQCLDLSRVLKKQSSMKMTVIPIIVGALGTILKCLKKSQADLEIRKRFEISQMPTFWDGFD